MTAPAHQDHAIAAEQQLLGAIMTDNTLFDRVSDVVAADHFLDPLHGRIFDICARRIGKGHLASAPALAPILADDEALAKIGGPSYLMRLVGAAASSFAVRDYGHLIVEHSCRRRLRDSALYAIRQIEQGDDAAEVRAALQQAIYALPEAAGQESSVSLLSAMTDAVQQANEAYQGNVVYLRTGVAALDQVIKGLAPGNVMLLGGTTSMGKTSLALEIAANVAMKQGGHVGFWSLEMSPEELATRMASAVSRVPHSDVRDAGNMAEADFRKWVEASQGVGIAPMRIVPKHVRDIAAGHAALRRIKRELGGKLDLVVIDYAQLIRGTGKGRYEQMTEVSIGIKAMAGLLECPVIALVQLDRKIGEREEKRPGLNDIKETGQFENDADQVVFCHREAYWLERQGPKLNKDGTITDQAQTEFEADMRAAQNVMELIVRKNRHGRLATCRVGFHAATNRFWALGHNDIQEGDGF